jgi:hypothetical protein
VVNTATNAHATQGGCVQIQADGGGKGNSIVGNTIEAYNAGVFHVLIDVTGCTNSIVSGNFVHNLNGGGGDARIEIGATDLPPIISDTSSDYNQIYTG